MTKFIFVFTGMLLGAIVLCCIAASIYWFFQESILAGFLSVLFLMIVVAFSVSAAMLDN